ncbi:MAG: hypothetical protein K940chlam8_00480 [Chlamydiae bacterium]|nr:hypothetical protein [Chlamydiota bacterium]
MRGLVVALVFLSAVFASEDSQKEHTYKLPKFSVVVMDEAAKLFSSQELQKLPLTFGLQNHTFLVLKNMPATIYSIDTLNQLGSSYLITDTALQSMSRQLVQHFTDQGIIGVYVNVDFTFEKGALSCVIFRVFVALCDSTRTLTPSIWPGQHNVDQYRFKNIRRDSPVKSMDQKDLKKSVVNKNTLDEYALFLNRYPNRRVDIQLRPLEQKGVVGIDYVITEKKPWRVYLNLANSGTEQIGRWVYSMGFIHTQAFLADSTFRMDYAASNKRRFHSYEMSYDVPFFNVHRSRIRAYISFNKFSSSQLSLPNPEFRGSQTKVGLQFYQNFYQKHTFFIDWILALQYRYIKGINSLLNQDGQARFLLPRVALRFDLDAINTRTFFEMGLSTTINGFMVGSRKSLQNLGRYDVDNQWFIVDGKLNTSHYINLHRAEDKNYPKVHEICLEANGQYAYNYRLIPELKAVVGGMYSVRGYPNSFDSGDSAYAAQIEYRYHLPRGFKVNPNPKKLFGKTFRVAPQTLGGATDWDLVFKFFSDNGYVYNNRPLAEINTFMLSAGGGIDFSLFDYLTLKMDVGVVLKNTNGTPVFNSNTGNVEAVFVKQGHTRLTFSGTLMY